jgi:putative membrane protein
MKKLLVKGIFLTGLVYFMSSCNNSDSSKDTTTSSDTSSSTMTRTDTTSNTTGGATTSTTARPSEADTKFAMEAADGGMMEVELGRLALTKATSPMVKQHAQMMVDDHGKANDELKSLAATKGITLPDSMSADHKKAYKNLSEKKGTAFDKAYTDMMVDDHKKDVDIFKDQADKGTDPDLKAWASGKVPTLQKHLDAWEMTKNGGKAKAGSDTSKH